MTKKSKKDRPIWALNITRWRKKRLKGLRKWSQDDLADEAGIHVNVVKKIEAGLGEGEYESRLKIAKALGISMSDIYDDGTNSLTKAMEDLMEIIKNLEAEAASLRRDKIKLRQENMELRMANLKEKEKDLQHRSQSLNAKLERK